MLQCASACVAVCCGVLRCIAVYCGVCCNVLQCDTISDRGPERLQTKIRESHSGLWDVGMAESPEFHRSFPNPAVRKFRV